MIDVIFLLWSMGLLCVGVVIGIILTAIIYEIKKRQDAKKDKD